MIGFH
jgi:DNA mismatch repair ATPase MutS